VVFEDVYQAVVYGIEEQLTGEVRSSVLAFWHSFVEPFFGRGERAYVQLHTKTELQQLEAEEHADKQSSSSSDEEEGKKGERACAHAFVCVFWGGRGHGTAVRWQPGLGHTATWRAVARAHAVALTAAVPRRRRTPRRRQQAARTTTARRAAA
jgi:hypothetical protein